MEHYLATRELRNQAAERIVTTWRCVNDGNDDKLLVRYIRQAIEAGMTAPAPDDIAALLIEEAMQPTLRSRC